MEEAEDVHKALVSKSTAFASAANKVNDAKKADISSLHSSRAEMKQLFDSSQTKYTTSQAVDNVVRPSSAAHDPSIATEARLMEERVNEGASSEEATDASKQKAFMVEQARKVVQAKASSQSRSTVQVRYAKDMQADCERPRLIARRGKGKQIGSNFQ